ncbi:hypothetical protein [Nonomuraea sediminis]|uniref:hypothetical protein n=1 Tax=Nonomuraea sediminis TaxID=2835864 RepID=UPI001BDBCD13|nr:hypothetical protein [Nonomuraea sediminis]
MFVFLFGYRLCLFHLVTFLAPAVVGRLPMALIAVGAWTPGSTFTLDLADGMGAAAVALAIGVGGWLLSIVLAGWMRRVGHRGPRDRLASAVPLICMVTNGCPDVARKGRRAFL